MLHTVIKKALAFQKEAHKILGTHEESPSRIIHLKKTYEDLGKLSLQQDELFRQSLRCIENRLYRAAHVMAWAGFMDFYEEKLASDRFKKLRVARPNWKFSSNEELRENFSEYQLIDVSQDIKLCQRTQKKALHGLLNKRNECAHPSDYYPGLNETLGYISELFQRISQLKPIKI